MQDKISRIEVHRASKDEGQEDVTFHFVGHRQPYNAREFIPGSPTRIWLDTIEQAILDGPPD